MEVSKKVIPFLLTTALIGLTACSKKEDEKFYGPSVECAQQTIEDSFLVKWKDGRITTVKAKDKDDFLENYMKEHYDEIEFAEHNQKISLVQNIKSSSVFRADETSLNWGAKVSNAGYAWQQGVTGDSVTVAVIDTGGDIAHSLLANQIAYNDGETGVDDAGLDKRTNGIDDDGNGYIDDYAGFNFIDDNGDIRDTNGHGTHVAGIISAEHTDSNVSEVNMQGIAPKAKILPLDFLDFEGNGNLDDAIEAIDYAAKSGAKVINASWGGSICAASLGEKIRSLSSNGILFVSAAGNNNTNIDSIPEYPAAFNFPLQITVGSTGIRGFKAEHSNYGRTRVHLYAPGDQIVSLAANTFSGLVAQTGTSMATPFVAATAALLWSARPAASAEQVRTAILSSVSAGNYQNSTGGALNIEQAIKNIRLTVP